jgi:pimeloyl-ACP methyl ester carboxylesterase
MRKCYEMLGAKDYFDDYVSKGGHDYRPDLRLAIFSFFHKHLKSDISKVVDADFPKIEGKDLRVFPTDADLPKDSINAKADETFVPVAQVKLPAEAKEFKDWKAGLVKQLREKCFRALPEKVPPAGVQFKGDKTSTLVVLHPDADPEQYTGEWSKKYPNSTLYPIVPRGTGPSRWTRKNPPNTVERSLVLVGQTADSLRVSDVAAVLAPLAGIKERPRCRLAGSSQAGIVAAYAAIFVPGAVDEVVILDPPVSHRDGPHFLNVLRVLDIPEALGLLASDVKLTLVGEKAKDKAFDRTAAIYKLAGAEDKFKRE